MNHILPAPDRCKSEPAAAGEAQAERSLPVPGQPVPGQPHPSPADESGRHTREASAWAAGGQPTE